MESPDVKQESKHPKREKNHEQKHRSHRAETDKPGSSTLSHIALGKRRDSHPRSIPASLTRNDERSMHREIAETPEIAISRRLAKTPDIAIGQRLPVRTTKVVPSIEAAESPSSSSSESEAGSDSEYDDEQWRRHLAQRRPVRKPSTKSLAPKPTKRVQASKTTAIVQPPQTTTTVLVVESPMTAPAPKPTASEPAMKPTTTVQASKSTAKPTAPQPSTSQSSPQLAPGCQPRKRPVKLKDDPAAWFAERVGKKRYSKKDQKELEDYNRRQRYGTANPHRVSQEVIWKIFSPYRQKNTQPGSTVLEPVSSAQSRPPSDVDEVDPQLVVSSGGPPTEDISICVSIERDQTPNLVDQLTEEVSQVVDRQDIAPEQTALVKGEISEVPGAIASTAEHQLIPDDPRFDTVSEEVAALRYELQFFKGQVSAYEKTLEVDGVQLQHRLAFDAEVKKKQDPKEPETHKENDSEASQRIPSEQERLNLEKRRGARCTKQRTNGDRRAADKVAKEGVPQGEEVPSSRTDLTDNRDEQRNGRGEPSATGRDSRTGVRTFTGPGPYTFEGSDHVVDGSSKERPNKRPKKGKPGFRKEKKGQAQGEIGVPSEAPNTEPSKPSNAAADQPQVLDEEGERILQLLTGFLPQISTAASPSRPSDLHAEPLPVHDTNTSSRLPSDKSPPSQGSSITTGAQPRGASPEASRDVSPVVSNNHLSSSDAPQKQAPIKVQQPPMASVTASGVNQAARGGRSGSGRSVWSEGVNSIPLGPRHPRREPPRGQTIHDRWNRPWRRPYDRREVFLPDSLPRCVCSLLHFYFESGLNQRPNLEAFPGTREEFFANIEQIVNCRGHDKEMIIFCEGLWASEKANRKATYQHYRFPTGMNVHLRFPDDDTILPADRPSSSRLATLPPEYGTHLKDECLDRGRRIRRERPSTIPPHLFYGTAAPGANGPGKRKEPPR